MKTFLLLTFGLQLSLLKTQRQLQMSLMKIVPSYFHHFVQEITRNKIKSKLNITKNPQLGIHPHHFLYPAFRIIPAKNPCQKKQKEQSLNNSIYCKYNFILMRTGSPRKYYQNPEYHHQAHQYNGKCVCQICECDNPHKRHKCPQPGFRLQTQTTSQHFYKPHAISPQKYQRKKYEPNVSRYEPADLVTNYKDTYRPHDLTQEDLRPRTAKPQYSPSKFKFQGESEYKTKYSPQKIKTEPSNLSPRKNREYVPSPYKFEGETTYKAEYSPKKNENSPSPRKKYEYSPSKFPLQTQTTYNNFYKPHKLQPSSYARAQPKDNVTFKPNNQKFEGQTRYREFYTPREIKPVRRCPADLLPQRPFRCSPDKKHTYYNAEGNRWE